MKLSEQLTKLSTVAINEQAIAKIEKEYRESLPNIIQRIISLHEETVSYDDFSLLRGLSIDEIIDASSDMAIDFTDSGLLPLFDIGDNDYIVFDLDEHCWYKFNIVDELKFSRANDLAEYF